MEFPYTILGPPFLGGREGKTPSLLFMDNIPPRKGDPILYVESPSNVIIGVFKNFIIRPKSTNMKLEIGNQPPFYLKNRNKGKG